MAGEFADLLPFTWRGLHLPLTNISLSLAHDLVEHKYWGVDGARVEATGVAPIRISATIPVVNSINPGKNEKWKAGALYPDLLRNFIIEFSKKTTGYVQHPEFGEIACKPEKMDFELSGEKQDCTEIKASWVETLDDALAHKLKIPERPNIELAASDLNASMQDLKALAPGLPKFQDDLESLCRKLRAFVDLPTIFSYRVVGLANRIFYQAHLFEVAIERAAKTPHQYADTYSDLANTLQRPFRGTKSKAPVWAARNAVQKIKESALIVRKAALSNNVLGLYTVPSQTTVAGVIQALPPGTSVMDVLKLNDNLARGPVVAKGTIVRYLVPK